MGSQTEEHLGVAQRKQLKGWNLTKEEKEDKTTSSRSKIKD